MPPKANSQGDEKPKDEKPSQNRFIKDGWGSYHNFLLSYGLKRMSLRVATKQGCG